MNEHCMVNMARTTKPVKPVLTGTGFILMFARFPASALVGAGRGLARGGSSRHQEHKAQGNAHAARHHA